MDRIKKLVIFHKGQSTHFCDSCTIAFHRKHKKKKFQKHHHINVFCGWHRKMNKELKRRAKRILQRELKKEKDNA